MKHVTIYCDGACSGNPGAGGWAAVLLHNGRRRELSSGFELTTNNRMELNAAIAGLEALSEKCQVTLYSDSKYLIESINEGWVFRWQQRGWWKTRKKRAKNADLWERFLQVFLQHEVKLAWVRGHSGNVENERCDVLATEALRMADLPVDEGYVAAQKPFFDETSPTLFPDAPAA